MTKKLLDALPDLERRRLLQLLLPLVTAPLWARGARERLGEMLLGTAYGAEAPGVPRRFIEINLRSQWDLGHIFVAPGLARNPNLVRAAGARGAALFYGPGELQEKPNNIFLTRDSLSLAPFVDSIALIDTCENPVGRVHGHEGVGALRSPGRSNAAHAGWQPTWVKDEVQRFVDGNELHYANVPTPACFHNAYMRRSLGRLGNGIAIKGCSTVSNVFHVDAGLAGADLQRFQNRELLIQHFAATSPPIANSAPEAALIAGVLKHLDDRFLKEAALQTETNKIHASNLEATTARLTQASQPFDLTLTAAETAYWSKDVMPWVGGRFMAVKPPLWEQCAYAYKLLAADKVRTIALEFDFLDVHDARSEGVMRSLANQVALPLARLIDHLKKANLYDDTIIAIYTVDGGRSPAILTPDTRNVIAYEGKNSVMLCGGAVKGGYYGDISAAGPDNFLGTGHIYAYHAPDPATGAPGPGVTNQTTRLAAGSVWRTVADLLKIPAKEYAGWSAVSNAPLLRFLRR